MFSFEGFLAFRKSFCSTTKTYENLKNRQMKTSCHLLQHLKIAF